MRLKRLWALLPLVAALGACDDFGLRSGGQGELRWIIGDSGSGTRASAAEIPDTNDFILKVSDAGGKILYEGAYGDSPESLLVDAGSYTVAVHSIEFTAPGFSRPVYGDEQVVVVKAGATVTVRLDCVLENAGVRLQVAPDFLTSYPDGVLFLKSGDTRLMYGYSEKRIAYFKPGPISLVLNNRGADEILLTRTLDAPGRGRNPPHPDARRPDHPHPEHLRPARRRGGRQLHHRRRGHGQGLEPRILRHRRGRFRERLGERRRHRRRHRRRR